MSRHGDVKIITGSLYLQGGPKGSDSSHTATGNITASGNMTIGGTVGIGIESPTKKFEVNMAGTSADDGVLISNTNNDARLYLTNNETSWLIQNDYSNSGNLSFHNGAASPNQHAMVIEKTGNVGIGTTTPAEMLTVEGNISASGTVYASRFEASGSGTKIEYGDDVEVYGDISSSGNIVAIGAPNNNIGPPTHNARSPAICLW